MPQSLPPDSSESGTDTLRQIRLLLQNKADYKQLYASVHAAMRATLGQIARHMAAELRAIRHDLPADTLYRQLREFVERNLSELHTLAKAVQPGESVGFPPSLRSAWSDAELIALAGVYHDVLGDLVGEVSGLASEATQWASVRSLGPETDEGQTAEEENDEHTLYINLEHVMQRRQWTSEQVGSLLRQAALDAPAHGEQRIVVEVSGKHLSMLRKLLNDYTTGVFRPVGAKPTKADHWHVTANCKDGTMDLFLHVKPPRKALTKQQLASIQELQKQQAPAANEIDLQAMLAGCAG